VSTYKFCKDLKRPELWKEKVFMTFKPWGKTSSLCTNTYKSCICTRSCHKFC
jgi:hypothetical protein